MITLVSKCGVYTSKGKKVLIATRAVINGRKAVAFVKNGELQGYEYLDDFTAQCFTGPCMTFEDGKGTTLGNRDLKPLGSSQDV